VCPGRLCRVHRCNVAAGEKASHYITEGQRQPQRDASRWIFTLHHRIHAVAGGEEP
jgi:hypothetical protein